MAEIEIKPLAELPPATNSSPVPIFDIEANTYDNLNYEEFFNNHMRKNVPCIIKNVGVEWEATKKWSNNNNIDFDYLSNQYGNLTVPVTDCKNIKFDLQPRVDVRFSDYIKYWKGSERQKLLYLKDWHLRRSKPDDQFYTVPPLFASDWLNEYAVDKHSDDFMFVYMGPADSWTPMHADVYSSFSWSVNVSGRKKWMLFPPGEEEKLKDKFQNVVLRFEPDKFKDKQVTYYEIIQGKGDAIFVPSGWYHQVLNEIDTISINHNWVNGSNIKKVWLALTTLLTSVQKEIDQLKDLEEFPSMCQNMLKNLYGMDCSSFAKFIVHIGEKRIAQIERGSNIGFSGFRVGKNHCMYDLKCIEEVMTLMIEHPTFVNNEYQLSSRFLALKDCFAYIF